MGKWGEVAKKIKICGGRVRRFFPLQPLRTPNVLALSYYSMDFPSFMLLYFRVHCWGEVIKMRRYIFMIFQHSTTNKVMLLLDMYDSHVWVAFSIIMRSKPYVQLFYLGWKTNDVHGMHHLMMAISLFMNNNYSITIGIQRKYSSPSVLSATDDFRHRWLETLHAALLSN